MDQGRQGFLARLARSLSGAPSKGSLLPCKAGKSFLQETEFVPKYIFIFIQGITLTVLFHLLLAFGHLPDWMQHIAYSKSDRLS